MIADLLPNKNIVLDSDSVILAFYPAFCEAFEAVLDRPATVMQPLFGLQERFGLTPEENNAVWRHFEREGYWGKLKPMPGAPDAIAELTREGFVVHVVSGVPPRITADRLRNFDMFGFKPASFHAAGSGRAEKRTIIEKINPIAFVDDRKEHGHSVQFVPHLAWVMGESPAEQYPVSGARIDVIADDLPQWVNYFLADPVAALKRRAEPVDIRANRHHMDLDLVTFTAGEGFSLVSERRAALLARKKDSVAMDFHAPRRSRPTA